MVTKWFLVIVLSTRLSAIGSAYLMERENEGCYVVIQMTEHVHDIVYKRRMGGVIKMYYAKIHHHHTCLIV